LRLWGINGEWEMRKLKIGFIGAGKVGQALGLYFVHHGLTLSGYSSRTAASAQEAAALTGGKWFYRMEDVAKESSVLFLTTPDHALPAVDEEAAALLSTHSDWQDKVWLHVSGAHASTCLACLSAAGCPVGSLHPLQSFGNPEISAEMLEKTHFSAEGTPKALQAVRQILGQTGGSCSKISTRDKPLYHTGACVISNYLVTLLDSGMRFMQAAGMDQDTLFEAVLPLIDGTLKNIREKGTLQALTGPIVRADYDTVAAHCRAIQHAMPQDAAWYRALAEKTVAFAEEGERLSHEQAETFRRILKGGGSNE